jgi:hypothetical protein
MNSDSMTPQDFVIAILYFLKDNIAGDLSVHRIRLSSGSKEWLNSVNIYNDNHQGVGKIPCLPTILDEKLNILSFSGAIIAPRGILITKIGEFAKDKLDLFLKKHGKDGKSLLDKFKEIYESVEI